MDKTTLHNHIITLMLDATEKTGNSATVAEAESLLDILSKNPDSPAWKTLRAKNGDDARVQTVMRQLIAALNS